MTTTLRHTVSPPIRSSSPNGRSALIVGAGLGGLATAVRHRRQGWRVTVLERAAVSGGRAGIWESEGFRFDTGPTLLLMVDHLRRVFTDAGRRLEDYLDLVQLEPNYTIRYSDGSSLDVSSRLNSLLASAEALEPGVSPRLLKFLSTASQLYRLGEAFVDRNVHKPREFFALGDAGGLAAGGAFGKLYRLVSRYFRDERLRQAFSFQSLYLGLSPYEAMGIYALLPYTEVAGGLHFPMGGMHAIPEALQRLASELGVDFEFNTEVASVTRSGDRVTGVTTAAGGRYDADLVVINADLPWAYESLLEEKLPRADRLSYSCSAFLMYLGVGRTLPDLPHHTLVVPDDLRGACEDIFTRHRIPDEPPFYLCNPSKTDPSLAPAGCENLYVLVPVPHQSPGKEVDWQEEGPRLAAHIYERMQKLGLPDLRPHLLTERFFTPEDFRSQFSATRGEAFGLSHGLMQVGYFRPQNRHATLTNLFFVGQSTHPGCGIPMAMISARCVAERIADEQPQLVTAP